MNSEATDKALYVPSILIVAPRGKQKRATPSGTDPDDVAQSIDTGIVAALEALTNAII